MPRRSTPPARWPLVLKSGSAEVKIYRHRKGLCDRFILAHYEGARRKQIWFSDLAAAKLEADAVLARITNGQIAALQLTGADKESYLFAERLLAPSGIPLHAAIEEYVKARTLLGTTPLISAVEDFNRRHREKLPEIGVEKLVAEALKAKKQDGASAKYLTQLSSDWGKVQRTISKPIHLITTTELEDWLRALKTGARTRNNLRTSVITLFSYARQRGYLPKNIPTEAEALSKAKVRGGEIEIFHAAQIEKLLAHATPEMIPFIALGGFAGLRSAESHRLHWDALLFDDDLIELKAGQAKTASRRLVPMEPNLKAWMQPLKARGKVIPDDEIWKGVTALAKKLEIGWPQNVLRHSYISFRVARDKDVNKVALDSGNSTSIIFQHYRQLATEKQAEEWFSVCPTPRAQEP